jgi:hypothetical protein
VEFYQKEMRKTYLYQLYCGFKLLFFVVAVWALGTLWFVLKSHEEFPFLLFGMYSLREPVQEEYLAYSIVVNGKEIVYKDISDSQQELVSTSLSNAAALKANPLATTGFINWLRNYTSAHKPMEIYRLTCFYSADGKPQIKKRELIYPHDQF